jgi:plasminogen activator inhibitor 1 RNA-binding protein
LTVLLLQDSNKAGKQRAKKEGKTYIEAEFTFARPQSAERGARGGRGGRGRGEGRGRGRGGDRGGDRRNAAPAAREVNVADPNAFPSLS